MTTHNDLASVHPTVGRGSPGPGSSRVFVGAVLITAAVVSAWPGTAAETGAAAQPEAPGTRPNVLFIAVDDLNDWTGFLGGYPGVETPNLDRLAARGTSFSRAYCSAPACNPSRASLLCGIRPSTSGVYYNGNPWRPQLPDAVTLPQHFMAHGYKVHGGGKIFHGAFEDPASWQFYLPRPRDPVPESRPVNGIPNTAHFDWGPVEVGDQSMGDTQVVDWGVKFLGEKHDRPFFLAVGLFRPHLPWYAPRKYFERYPLDRIKLPKVNPDDLDDVPALGVRMARPEGDHAKVLAHQQWEEAVQGYLASITYADGQVGRLLDALDRSPYAGNTVIVLWGDHGWHLGEKLHWRKFALWEEATRVPLVFVVPGLTKADTRCERTVSLLDIYPTLADLCALPILEPLEGRSLRPLLKDPQGTWDRPVVTTHGKDNHAVRSERWRYIRYSDGSEELYDHQQDPLEWTNLAGQAEYVQVKQELARWLPEVNVEEGSRAGKAPQGKAAQGKARAPKARELRSAGRAGAKRSAGGTTNER